VKFAFGRPTAVIIFVAALLAAVGVVGGMSALHHGKSNLAKYMAVPGEENGEAASSGRWTRTGTTG